MGSWTSPGARAFSCALVDCLWAVVARSRESMVMRPVSRRYVNKSRSARSFRKNVSKTKGANVRAPMRGGWRM